MLKHLQQRIYMKQLTLYAEDSHAKTSVSPDSEQVSQVSVQVSGTNSTDSSKKRNRDTSSLKTSQPFALEDWTKSSAALLRSGTMRNGIVYPLKPLALLTREIESGLWPTPTTFDAIAPKTPKAIHREMTEVRPNRRSPSNLRDQVTWGRTFDEVRQKLWPTPSARDHKGGYIGGRIRNGKVSWDTLDVAVQWTDNQSKTGGQLNPQWVEWLMGFPVGHTDLNNSETP
jgi:hypothetical protein